MKRLLFAIFAAVSISASNGQPSKPAGYSAPMPRPAAPLPAQTNMATSAGEVLRPDAGPLEKARFYFDEKSWQLAVNTADQSNTSTLSNDGRRELSYIKGRALAELHKQGEANEVFKNLIESNSGDVWAGRAHWRMQDGLGQDRWINATAKDPLGHLRAADRIITDAKPDDLDDFYMDVINSNLATTRFPEEEDRNYVLSFFDKIVPLLAGNEDLIAGVQLRRQTVLDAQNTDRTPEERLSGMRGIVSEFPRTRAAAQAQWQVANYYIGKKEYVPALYELSLLTNQFAGTEEADRAAEEIQKIKRGEAAFVLPQQFLPGEKITFELASRNTEKVRFTAIPFDIIEEMKRQKVTQLDLAAIQGKPEFTENITTEGRDDYLPTSRTVTLDIDKRGVYVLRAEVDGKATCNAMLVISDLAMAGNMGPQGYEFWTVDAKTGRPRANSKITVAHDQQRENHWATGRQSFFFAKYDNIESNSSGFADFKFPKQESNQLFAMAADGDNAAFLGNIYWSQFESRQPDAPLAYIYTDRPVYRPAQKVYWRAIVRQRLNGQFQASGNHKYRVVINDAKNQEVFQKSGIALSEFGTAEGEMTLVAGAPLGMYRIIVTDETDNSRQIGDGQFRVEEYKKPEFEVSVESASDFARVGDKVKALVEAKYLFGSPVTDATVKYSVRRRPRYRIMWNDMSWHFDDRDLGWFEAEPERPPILHGSGGVIVAEGEGKLDANGNFTLNFDSTVPDNELKAAELQPQSRFGYQRMIWPPQPTTWDFQVEVTVTDASRRNIDASQVIPVGLKALNLAAKTERTIVTPGDNARVELKSMNLADKPVPTSGTLFVEKLVWNEKAKEDDITTVSSQAVTVEASGSLVLNWRVPADLHGRLRFAYIVDDPFGGKSVAYANFYAVSSDDTDVMERYQGVEIVTDKTRYTVGETARVMILSEYKDAVAWYWIDTGSGNLDKQVLPLPHRTNFVSFPITDAFVPNSQVHVVAVRDKKLITDEVELVVPPTSRVINVEITPNETTVQPGQQGTVSIRATDEHGQPVTGEFSLSIFDQAITYIAPDTRMDIRKVFYGMKRPLRSDIRSSLGASAQYGGSTINDIYRYLNFDDLMGRSSGLDSGAVQLHSLSAPTPVRAMAGMPPPAMMAPQSAAVPAMEKMESRMAADALGISELYYAKSKSNAVDEAPAIRADFRDSMFWSPTVRTDASGSATVTIKYPDSLTTWRMVAVGLTQDARVGNTTTETVARKNVLVRLQTPRFFRERDQVTISANVHNYTDSDLAMDSTLRVKGVELDGATTMPLQGDSGFVGNTQKITVPAGGEKRVDWAVNVKSADAGDAILNVMALSQGGSDAMQTTVPLLPHGIDKFVAWNGSSRDETSTVTGALTETSGTAKIITRTVSLPAERIRETSRLEINVNPSLASSIRDAIPYMIDYPYGCVEQTLSRFVPAVVAARAFQVLGYPLDQSMQERLPKVTADALKRLRDMQLPSGGWGWWVNDSENLYMTAYTMYGLTLAREAEVAVDPAMFDSGLRRLGQLRDEITSKSATESTSGYWYPNNLHNLMFAEYVMTLNNRSSSRTIGLLWDRRDELSAHGLSMLARTMGKLGRQADAEVVLRNMVNMAVVQPENNTLRWGRIDTGWRWYDDPVEATAVGLMAYLELKPDDPAVEQAMKWLVLNRQGRQWKSTRDTAQAVLALTQYMVQRNEAARPVKIEVRVGDRLVKTLAVNPQNFWDFDGNIVLRGDEIPDGDFPVSFTVDGEGSMYYSIFAEYFTLEEGIKKAGNEIYVTRTYEILHREKTSETVNGKSSPVSRDDWVPLNEGDAIKSGDELRVTLKIKSLNDYEYLVFEDPKPAGMEPVDLQSGSKYGNGLCSNMELRDAWVAFFITHLRQGEHTLSYRVRAEIPGQFHTMPTTGYAMYFPPLRANADEAVMKVVD